MTDDGRDQLVAPALRPRSPAPHLEWECHFWDGGYQTICAVDEVGRGALAGPLVAAAVIFSPGFAPTGQLSDVCDSKLLDRDNRARLAACIRDSGALVGVGWVEPAEIDELGLTAANRAAMCRAISATGTEPDVLLLDAVTLDLGTVQLGLIDGDAQCFSIAAASIVAKEARDAVMREVHGDYPEFGFASHVGYGTKQHLRALASHGPCPIHRRSFAPVAACCR